MGIPTRTLDSWTSTGADRGSKTTRRAIYNALRSERSPLEQKDDDYDVHTQGSYRNSTHIRGDSDVDVIEVGIGMAPRSLRTH
jgi:tRNA nucleotidyltransferase (CCA-adding enzyme)